TLEGQLARTRVDGGADVVLGAVAGARTLGDRLFDRLDDDLLVDGLLARHGFGDLQELKSVGADPGDAHQAFSSSVSVSLWVSIRAARASAPRFIKVSVRT